LIVPLLLSHLIARCAPRIGPVTMSAIVLYESAANAYAIGDNTARRAYFPPRRSDAERLARRLLRAGHNVDVGYAQINSANFRRFGLEPGSALDPCTNLSVGARILEDAYANAAHTYGTGQTALAHALSAYNTGGFWAGLGYARNVYATAAHLEFGPTGAR
jgi:type IV secretion system protein VirB1